MALQLEQNSSSSTPSSPPPEQSQSYQPVSTAAVQADVEPGDAARSQVVAGLQSDDTVMNDSDPEKKDDRKDKHMDTGGSEGFLFFDPRETPAGMDTEALYRKLGQGIEEDERAMNELRSEVQQLLKDFDSWSNAKLRFVDRDQRAQLASMTAESLKHERVQMEQRDSLLKFLTDIQQALSAFASISLPAFPPSS